MSNEMKHQLQTIRAALELAGAAKLSDGTYLDSDCKITFALTALSEIERMAGEPVAWFDERTNTLHWSDAFKPGLPAWPHAQFYSKAKAPEAWLELYAAPPAQQPQAEAVPMTDEQIDKLGRDDPILECFSGSQAEFTAVVRAAEKFHGIVGKEGGTVVGLREQLRHLDEARKGGQHE